MKKRSILLHYFAFAVLAVGAVDAGLASKTAHEVRNERTGPLQSRPPRISAIPTDPHVSAWVASNSHQLLGLSNKSAPGAPGGVIVGRDVTASRNFVLTPVTP